MIEKSNFFVFTGGPGVGKTTLLRQLESLGELVVEESARAVIREEMAAGGDGVPWKNPERMCRLCAARDIAVFERMAGETRRVFFDRGIMDSYGANGIQPWPELEIAVAMRRYNPKVFVFPPWREIYATDAERKQDWAEAEATFGKIMVALPKLGYSPVVVPIRSVKARARFVLAQAT